MFERFTDRARRVVVLAQEEARRLNHDYIGTEHILLGLIREGEGVAARALESLGISLEVVRQQVEEIIGRGQHGAPGHIPFTPRAKKVLELSLREANAPGHDYIGTEHILLGLIREGSGVAAQVLVKLGADLNRVRQQVVQLLYGHQGKDVTGKGLPLPGDPLTRVDSLDHRLAAIERWVGLRPDLEDLDQEIARVRRAKEAAIDQPGFRGLRRAARPGEATAGCPCWSGEGVGTGRCWPHAAGPGIGPGEGRAGQTAGLFARARHRTGRRRRIGVMRRRACPLQRACVPA